MTERKIVQFIPTERGHARVLCNDGSVWELRDNISELAARDNRQITSDDVRFHWAPLPWPSIPQQ